QPRQLLPIMTAPHRRAVNRDLLLEDPPDVLIRLRPASRAAGDEPSPTGQRPNAASPGRGADVVDHDIDPTLLRQPPDLLREISRRLVDEHVGAQLPGALQLLVAS